MGDPMAEAIPGTLLPDTMRSIVVVSQDGELAVAVRDAVDPAMALVRDVRPHEAGAGLAACRPWPWVLSGDVAALPSGVPALLQRLPVLVLWLGSLPDGMPRHAVGLARYSLLAGSLRAACHARIGGMRLGRGLGVVMADGGWESSAALQALVSLHPAGFHTPREAFRGAARALARHHSAWRPSPRRESGAIALANPMEAALAAVS